MIERQPPWWGEFALQPGQARGWQVGPTSLVILRYQQEYRLYSRSEAALTDESAALLSPAPAEEWLARLEDAELVRHIVGNDDGRFKVLPALADRAVVSKPLNRFILHPGEQIEVYVGSPLWLQVHSEAGSGPLFDLPIFRPSDTWFGVTTREGDLCYATRTHARASLEEVPMSPIRAVTPVRLRNEGDKPLPVEKIRLPVSLLTLYSDAEGRLVTEPVSIRSEKHNEPSSLSIAYDYPSEQEGWEKVMAPRERAQRGLIHSLNVLLG